jgi:hypothetical protein
MQITMSAAVADELETRIVEILTDAGFGLTTDEIAKRIATLNVQFPCACETARSIPHGHPVAVPATAEKILPTLRQLLAADVVKVVFTGAGHAWSAPDATTSLEQQ